MMSASFGLFQLFGVLIIDDIMLGHNREINTERVGTMEHRLIKELS